MVGDYSLAARCLSEFLGTATAIYLGESIIANEVLPRTKGHALGFGFVALGFAFAFFVAIISFGFISAHVNPASLIALAILDEITWGDFFALSVCEIAGAFLGAVLVYIHYQPHFKTAPEPPAPNDTVGLIRRRDVYSQSALNFVLTREPTNNAEGWAGYVSQVRNYFRTEHNYADALDNYKLANLMGQPVSHLYSNPAYSQSLKSDTAERAARPRRRSIQVADLHQRIQRQQLLELRVPQLTANSTAVTSADQVYFDVPKDAETGAAAKAQPTNGTSPTSQEPSEMEDAEKHVQAALASAVKADKAAKLAIFVTKPAIRSLINNFIQEFLGTFALIWGALLIEQRAHHVPPDLRPLYEASIKPIAVGFLIFVCILALGGATGYAVNPARDLGPRLAHFCLPIPGKGGSEWGYAWVPIVGPLCGGATAGLVHWLFQKINHTQLEEGFYEAALG